MAKEVLRKWEIRYGFPVPDRDQSGNRDYSAEQLECLRLIKKLIDDGKRPSKIVGFSRPKLESLLNQDMVSARAMPSTQNACVINWLKKRDLTMLQSGLQASLDANRLPCSSSAMRYR